MSVLDWNEKQVNQFFLSLNLNCYEQSIKDHGITGDVLVHLDNELLKDIGIHSVGKRLAILKAIYKLKIRDDIPIEDGHWVPPLGDIEIDQSDDTQSTSSIYCSQQQNSSLSNSNPSINNIHPTDSLTNLILARDERIKSLESQVRSMKLELQSFVNRWVTSNPNSPNHLDSISSNTRHMTEDSIRQLVITDQSNPSPVLSQHSLAPTFDDSKSSHLHSPAPSTVTTPQDPSFNPSVTTTIVETKPTQPIPSTSSNSSTLKNRSTQSIRNEKNDPSNPYKNFRVTLEDPCYKVLPAALKKYKIKEHYKNYVLFICYGKQERCLSYEEKPLLLFQKLKEANQNPVFTLRHIKDIESPISIALTKHAQRKEKRSIILDSQKNQTAVNAQKRPPPNLSKVEEANGFCIAIYPYMSEGDEDFDVGVGDTFLITGKSKGWWVVNRDKGPETDKSESKQGWIPSGCVLETARSFTIGSSGKIDYFTSILPEEILSTSSSCYGLMEYRPKGPDEVGMKNGDQLKVYKRYNNWSYAINESRIDKPRGWAPSWLIGNRKQSSTLNSTSSSPSINSSPQSVNNVSSTSLTTSSEPILSVDDVGRDNHQENNQSSRQKEESKIKDNKTLEEIDEHHENKEPEKREGDNQNEELKNKVEILSSLPSKGLKTSEIVNRDQQNIQKNEGGSEAIHHSRNISIHHS
ncbi:hypothetical protein O181_007124 [Austropuccinia psidii MF-1]|uniref:Uncharacterized protein n=1 Tax=Austropuccinia psidii MF-1 TaxID=1389203 RepID=A0A9Q3GHJ9_9BASI|nr:hypothetical protein [Austropuccinia psidii MF-1]